MKKIALVLMCGALAAGAANMNAQDASAQGGQRRGGMRGGMGGGMMGGGSPVMGVVESVGDKSITVKDEDGNLWTIDQGENTRVRKEREPAKWADIAKGQAVVAFGMAEPGKKEVHAMAVSMLSNEEAQRMAEGIAQAKANLGKTFLVGKITKIDETKLTIKRQDGVEQVAAVDENTSLRKGGGMGGRNPMMGAGAAPAAAAAAPQGEPITLADVQVGDFVTGPGEIKSGTFTFKELHVAVRPNRAGAGATMTPPPAK